MTSHNDDTDEDAGTAFDRQKEREEEQWKLAAKKEGLLLSEFKRRACDERAFFILNPGTRLMAGVFEGVTALVKKEPVVQLEKHCVCGHSEHYHPATPGTTLRGSCGKPTCECKKFSERTPGSKAAAGSGEAGKKDERKT